MAERNEQQAYLDFPKPAITNTADTVPSPVRRRLVKGSTLALPAIITLHYSGAAAAASAVNCVTKNANAQPSLPANAAISGTDSLLREPVITYQDTDVNSTIFYKDNYSPYPYRDAVNGLSYTPVSTSNQITSYNAVVYLSASGVPVSNGPPASTASWDSMQCFCSVYPDDTDC